METLPAYQSVKVEREDGITWLYFNRPEKRNAMSPQLCAEMVDALTRLEADDATQVLVLTGAGELAAVPPLHAAGLSEAHDRDGQRLVLRRRLQPAHVV